VPLGLLVTELTVIGLGGVAKDTLDDVVEFCDSDEIGLFSITFRRI